MKVLIRLGPKIRVGKLSAYCSVCKHFNPDNTKITHVAGAKHSRYVADICSKCHGLYRLDLQLLGVIAVLEELEC